MEEKEVLKYCPRCKGNLDQHPNYNNHLKCKGCDFDFYLNVKPTVSAIILNDKKEVLLTKRNYEPDKNTWEVPGGFIDKKETIEGALRREIKEELDINISNPRYLFSLTCKYKLSKINYNLLVLYFICDFSGEVKVNEENSDFGFFDLNNLPDNFHTPHLEALNEFKKSLH